MKKLFRPAFIFCAGLLFLLTGCVDQKNGSETSTTAYFATTTIPASAAVTDATTMQFQTTTSSTATPSTSPAASTTTTTEPAVNASAYKVRASINLSKPAYKSGERMDITVNIDSSGGIRPAVVRLYGIYADYYRMNKSEKFQVNEGKNAFKFTYTTPPCNICSGIRPGNYVITTEVSYDGTVLARSNRNVVLEQ